MYRIGMMSETIYNLKGMKGALKVIKDLGFECADITIQAETFYRRMNRFFGCKNYLENAKELKEYADKINLPLVQAHAPFPSYLDKKYGYNKRRLITLIKSIEICEVLGIKNLVIHPLNDFSNEFNINFYKKLLPYAIKHNVTICAENMWRWDKEQNLAKPCSCSFCDTFNAIIDGVNSKHLKACVDIGHAQMFQHMNYSPSKMIKEMGDRVVCLHIHDNDGIKDKHWIPFTGVIDFKSVIKALKDINYKGDFIAEISIDKNIKSFKERVEYYKQTYNAMKKIQQMFLNN